MYSITPTDKAGFASSTYGETQIFLVCFVYFLMQPKQITSLINILKTIFLVSSIPGAECCISYFFWKRLVKMKVPIYNEKTIQNKETLESNTKQGNTNENKYWK